MFLNAILRAFLPTALGGKKAGRAACVPRSIALYPMTVCQSRPHLVTSSAMVPSASQPVMSSSTFAESSEPFFVATP